MVDYEQFLESANKYARTADHLLTNTYPLVKDPKMLLSVLHNVFMSYKCIVMYFLYRDLALGRIPEFETDFEMMIDLFKARSERRYNIKDEYIKTIEEVHAIVKDHKESPVEFARHDMFIICSDTYRLKTITTHSLREYIDKAKLFIHDISTQKIKHE